MIDTTLAISAAGAVAFLSFFATYLAHRHARAARRRRRELERAAGAGAYAPTDDVPRGADLAVAIAEHLRLMYPPVDAVHQALRRGLGYRVAAIAAAALRPDHERREQQHG